MQIPTSAGMLTNSVLPVTPIQGALLSQVGETAGSTSFAPVEAVSTTYLSRAVPEQRPQPSNAPESSGRIDTSANVGEQAVEDQGVRDQGAEPVNNPSATQINPKDAQTSEAAIKNSDQQAQQQEQQTRKQEQQQQQDLDIVRSLSQRDSEVHAHENAHSAVGGQYAGAANYTYQRGPDGVNYAVGGEVAIDVGVIPGNPQATLEKMQLVQRAALAPAEPSSQDRRVASLAAQQANQARAEIASSSRGSSSSNADELSAAEKADKVSINGSSNKDASPQETQGSVEKVGNEVGQNANNQNFQAANDRMAKINEILVAISQTDTKRASGQLLDAVV